MLNLITQLLVLLIPVSVTVSFQLCGNQNPQQTVDQAFIDSKIVEDLGIKLPSNGLDLIEVTYSNGISSKSVSCGTEFKSYQTLLEPKINYQAESNTNYTFMMLDIDAPNPVSPILRSFIHWMVINVKDNDLKSGSTIHRYLSPMPTPLLGSHRYVYLVFEQPEVFTIDQNAMILDRNNFNVAEWAEKNTVFGPVGGNYLNEANP